MNASYAVSRTFSLMLSIVAVVSMLSGMPFDRRVCLRLRGPAPIAAIILSARVLYGGFFSSHSGSILYQDRAGYRWLGCLVDRDGSSLV